MRARRDPPPADGGSKPKRGGADGGTEYNPPPPPEPAPRTLLDELEDARRARDDGAQTAADSSHPYWRLAAEQAIRELAASGRVFTAEDLRDRVGQLGGHANSVGGLFLAAARRGDIVAAGYRQATRAEAHGRVLRAWRGAS